MGLAIKDVALGLVILVITVSIGAKIVGTVRDTYTNTSSEEYSVAQDGAEALEDYGDWFSIIVIVSVGAFIIGYLGMFSRPSA